MQRQKLWSGDIIVGNIHYSKINQPFYVKTDNKTAEQLTGVLHGSDVPFSAKLRLNGEGTVTVGGEYIEFAEQQAHKINPSFTPKYTAPKPTFQDILSRFQNVKQSEKGQYVANCPCCSDTKQHLYIKSNDVGVALDCKKGCSAQEIVSTIGLKMSDLFTSQQYFSPKSGYVPRQITSKINQPKPTANIKNDVPESPIKTWRKYKYFTTTGEPLLKEVAVRENGDKFAIWKRYEDGKLTDKLNGLKPSLYHAENLSKSNFIFIVEGEKDVHSMEKLGFFAVCSPHGSKWNADYVNLFQDKTVVVITDNDEPGKKYGRDIAESLGKNGNYVGERTCRQGVVVSAKNLLPMLKEKGDVSDIVALKGEDFVKEVLAERINKHFPPSVNIAQVKDTTERDECREKNYIGKDFEGR